MADFQMEQVEKLTKILQKLTKTQQRNIEYDNQKKQKLTQLKQRTIQMQDQSKHKREDAAQKFYEQQQAVLKQIIQQQNKATQKLQENIGQKKQEALVLKEKQRECYSRQEVIKQYLDNEAQELQAVRDQLIQDKIKKISSQLTQTQNQWRSKSQLVQHQAYEMSSFINNNVHNKMLRTVDCIQNEIRKTNLIKTDKLDSLKQQKQQFNLQHDDKCKQIKDKKEKLDARRLEIKAQLDQFFSKTQ